MIIWYNFIRTTLTLSMFIKGKILWHGERWSLFLLGVRVKGDNIFHIVICLCKSCLQFNYVHITCIHRWFAFESIMCVVCLERVKSTIQMRNFEYFFSKLWKHLRFMALANRISKKHVAHWGISRGWWFL